MSTSCRRPTDDEYRSFCNPHSDRTWQALTADWCCPCCRRSRREVLRWGIRKDGTLGWKGSVYRHHDHSPYRRFAPTVVCGACNSADAHAKKAIGAPRWFSFAPDEILSFITRAHPNGPVELDFDAAQKALDAALDLAAQPIVDWFLSRFESPEEHTPRDDGKWLIEPQGTEELIWEYPDGAPDEVVQAAIKRIEEETENSGWVEHWFGEDEPDYGDGEAAQIASDPGMSPVAHQPDRLAEFERRLTALEAAVAKLGVLVV